MIINHALVGEQEKTLVLQDGKIVSVTDAPLSGGLDVGGNRVIPGLIDVHTHGGMGRDTMDADLTPLCDFYARNGTTSFLPTTMTASLDDLQRVTQAPIPEKGAHVLGFHLEGPYLSPQYKGAQNEACLQKPNAEDFLRLQNVRMVTVAPELEGCLPFIRAVSKQTVVSLGHTACDYETALAAAVAGATCLTHMYNAMPPLLHRAPGPIGAGMMKRMYAQLICDGFHVSAPAALAAYRLFGPERLTLISDSIRPAGMPDGTYSCGGLTVIRKDNTARLEDGTIAGSIATLWDCVKKAVEFGIPFTDAVKMATETPATLLGVPKGKIAEGYDADLLILNAEGAIETVIIDGEIYA